VVVAAARVLDREWDVAADAVEAAAVRSAPVEIVSAHRAEQPHPTNKGSHASR